MKIDISSLIGSLVDATVKSLNEAPKKPEIDPDTIVKYRDGDKNKEMKFSSANRQPADSPAKIAAEKLKSGETSSQEPAGTEKKKKTKKASDVDKKTDSEIEKLVGDEGGEEKEYNKEEAKAKLSEAGFKKNKLPEGIVKADKSIKQALENGFNENKKQGYKPAPGNAGSLMNECFSVVGVNMIDAMKPNKPDAEQLKDLFIELYGNTKAIKGISEKERDKQVLIAAQAAITKSEIVDDVKKGNPEAFGENTEILSYYGSSTSLQNQYDLLQGMKDDPDAKLYDDKGNEIDFVPQDLLTYQQVRNWNNPETNKKFTAEETKALLEDQSREGVFNFVSLAALNGGGGGNPSDTASIIRDGNNVSFIGYSDKQTLADQQANSTPAKFVEVMRESISYLESTGYEFDEQSKKELNNVLTDMGKEFAKSEKELARAALGPATEFSESLEKGPEENAEAIMGILNDPKVAGEGAKGNAQKRAGRLNNIAPNAKLVRNIPKAELIDPENIPTFEKYLKDAGWKDGEPTREEKAKAWMLLRSDTTPVTFKDADGNVNTSTYGETFITGEDKSIMGKLTDGIKKQPNYKPNNEDLLVNYLSVVEKARQDSLASMQDGLEKLNKYEIEDENGNDFKMGDVMYGFDLVEKLHLYGIDGPKAPGLYAYGGVKLVAGDNKVDAENMAECLKADSSEELLKRIKTRPPAKEGPTFKYRGKDVSESQMQRARVTKGDTSKAAKTADGQFIYLKDGEYIYANQDEKPPTGATQLGVITGQKTLVYYQDDKGNEVPIGVQVLRSKQGVAGKLDTTYLFSKDLQDCLAGKNKD